MPKPVAKAFPRKRFFLDMFTRDIFLDDCILDLIDNSIDSLIRRDSINIADDILAPSKPLTGREQQRLPRVDVRYDTKSFSILDNCGGISRADARTDAFNFWARSTYCQRPAIGCIWHRNETCDLQDRQLVSD